MAPEIAPFDFGDVPLNAGDAAQTQCLALKGDTPLNFTWTFQGDVGAFQSGIDITSVGQRGSAVIIDSVTTRHAGTYTCTVRNQVASASYSTNLIVNGTPIFYLKSISKFPVLFTFLRSTVARGPFSQEKQR